MRRLAAILVPLAFVLLATLPARAETFVLDKNHTSVVFLIDHLGFARVIGRFNDFEGEFTLDEGKVEKSKLRVVIRTKSVDTGFQKRDDHLRSPDFFSVREFPEMVFESTRIRKTDDRTGEIDGKLTMLGRTKQVTLRVRFNRKDAHPLPQYRGVMAAGFSARGSIRRSDFGMTYGQSFLGDEVEIWIEAEGLAKGAE